MVGGSINECEFIFLNSDWTGARYAESAPMTMKVNVKAIGRNSLLVVNFNGGERNKLSLKACWY